MSNEDVDNQATENNEIETEQAEVADATEQSPEQLQALLTEAEKKAEENWNELLRARADMENMRRRQTRDLENAHKHALDKFVAELLPIYDSMELGHQAATTENASLDAVREGLEMTMKMFMTSIGKLGLEQIDPEGEAFDPERHQAMSMQQVDGVEANQVLSVVQKGYQFNGRLLRPAMVVVSQ